MRNMKSSSKVSAYLVRIGGASRSSLGLGPVPKFDPMHKSTLIGFKGILLEESKGPMPLRLRCFSGRRRGSWSLRHQRSSPGLSRPQRSPLWSPLLNNKRSLKIRYLCFCKQRPRIRRIFSALRHLRERHQFRNLLRKLLPPA
jgi:hypothetical protein